MREIPTVFCAVRPNSALPLSDLKAFKNDFQEQTEGNYPEFELPIDPFFFSARCGHSHDDVRLVE